VVSFSLSATSKNNTRGTGDKFTTSVVDIGGKFVTGADELVAGVVDTDGAP
jgi:hypothetical protein